MTGPSEYSPVGPSYEVREILPFYKTTTGVTYALYDENYTVNYGICSGFTYISNYWYELDSRVWGSGRADEFAFSTKTINRIFSKLPPDKRTVEAQMFSSYGPWNFFNDTMVYPSFSTSFSWLTDTGSEFGSTGPFTGRYNGAWPVTGITAMKRMFNAWLDGIGACGNTPAYLMGDKEGSPFSDAGFAAIMGGDTRYGFTYYGLTSWKDIFESQGGTLGLGFAVRLPNFGTNGDAWSVALQEYESKVYDLCYGEIYNRFPSARTANYGNYKGEPGLTFNSPGEDGAAGPAVANYGNSPAPVIYCWLRQMADGSGSISAKDPTTYLPSSPSGALVTAKDKFVTGGPWATFLQEIARMRIIKRNNLNTPILAWLGSIDMESDYHNLSIDYTPSSSTPRVALHDTWYKPNITRVTRGFTSPIGDTNAFAIRTSTTNGTTSSVQYYYNGITAGITYNFSYWLNLNQGFSGSLSTFTTFKNPYVGLTYSQILPIASGPYNGNGTIGFTAGNSGWTKLSWEFVGTTNTTLAAYLYHAQNVTGGYTAFVYQPQLEVVGVSGNTIVPMTELDVFTPTRWRTWPTNGTAKSVQGRNSRNNFYRVFRNGNTAYWSEVILHSMLNGVRAFYGFNPSDFIDWSLPGMENTLGDGNFSTSKRKLYFQAGKTDYIENFTILNNTMADYHQKIGGFTLATGNTEKINWFNPYVISGQPGLNGNTWWWRITVAGGYTLYVNGETLAAPNKVGTWVSTTSPDWKTIPITYTAWPIPTRVPNEPSIRTPDADINFLTNSGTTYLTQNGFVFTRGSSASYIGPSGYVLFVGNNIPRFDYDPDTLQPKGLLLERSSTNLLNWSESFANTGGLNNDWIDTNISRSIGNTAPSGITFSIRFTGTAANATLLVTSGLTTSELRVLSFWARGITGTEILNYTINGGTNWSFVSTLGNTWQRFYSSPTASTHSVGFQIGNTGNSVELWGVQLETTSSLSGSGSGIVDVYGDHYTSYISTTSTTATRAADVFHATGSSFSSWFDRLKGTFIFETENSYGSPIILTNALGLNANYIILDQGFNEQISFSSRLAPSGSLAVSTLAEATNRSSARVWTTYGIYPKNNPIKTVMSYDINGVTGYHFRGFGGHTWISGQSLGQANLQFLTFRVDTLNSAASRYKTNVKRIRYWNEVLAGQTCSEFAQAGLYFENWWNPLDLEYVDIERPPSTGNPQPVPGYPYPDN